MLTREFVTGDPDSGILNLSIIAQPKAMDTSTILFVVTLAVAFIFLRWLISPIPQSNEFGLDSASTALSTSGTSSGSTSNSTSASASASARRSSGTRNRRPVADSMIDVVLAIAPTLTREQIAHDLRRTGSVEQTVDRYMELGTLPHPPGAQPQPENLSTDNSTPDAAADDINVGASSKGAKGTPINLIERFAVDVDADTNSLDDDDESGNSSNLKRRKQKMILEARNRLKQQLANEVDLPLK